MGGIIDPAGGEIVGGFIGGIIGGAAGYWSGSNSAKRIYDLISTPGVSLPHK